MSIFHEDKAQSLTKTEFQSVDGAKERPLRPRLEKKFKRWTGLQNQAYALFLKKNIEEFSHLQGRRRRNSFLKMSQHLNNGRNREQCRSHHQKLLQRHGTVEQIIRNIEKQLRCSGPTNHPDNKPDLAELVCFSDLNAGMNYATNCEMVLVGNQGAHQKDIEESFFYTEGMPCLF